VGKGEAKEEGPQNMAAQGPLRGVAKEPSNSRDLVKAMWSMMTGDESEDEQIDTVLECVICMRNQKNRMLHPCGHVCVCQDCGTGISKCPICRTDITGTIPAYI
jgi:hypothetical protein